MKRYLLWAVASLLCADAGSLFAQAPLVVRPPGSDRGGVPVSVAGQLPGVDEDPNAADSAGLEWISRDANYIVSSRWPLANGRFWEPLPSLLTGEGPMHDLANGQDLFAFHTAAEYQPYALITLRETARIERIFIEDRRVESQEMRMRGSGMAVWLSEDGNNWQLAWRAQRGQPSWSIRFATPVTARHVRVGLVGSECLHLAAVRIYGPSIGLPALTRLANADRILLGDGTALLGTIEDKQFTVEGILGKVQISPFRVVGIVPDANAPGRVRLVLADGQVIAGALPAAEVRFRLDADSNRSVPWRDIRQVAYRTSKEKPETPRVAEPYVLLQSGDRLIWTGFAEKLQLDTPYGQVGLPPTCICSLEAIGADGGTRPAGPPAATHRATLHGGSTLRGTLAPLRLTLKLRTFPDLQIEAGDIRRLSWPAALAQATSSPAVGMIASAPLPGSFTLVMKSGDRLVGRLDPEVLTVRTESENIRIHAASIRTMSFAAPGSAKAEMWDDATLSGQLVDSTLRVFLGPEGPTAPIKVDQVVSISNARPLPPPETQEKVQALVIRLGADAYKDREVAQDALAAMGKGILPMLESHRKSDDPEIRVRIEALIEQLRQR